MNPVTVHILTEARVGKGGSNKREREKKKRKGGSEQEKPEGGSHSICDLSRWGARRKGGGGEVGEGIPTFRGSASLEKRKKKRRK